MYAAAEVGEVLDGLQASACVLGECGEGRREEVAEGFLVAASHASPHLVEVAESEAVRPADDDGVGVGDVESALDDGGGDEHVVVVGGEVRHHLLQVGGRHLAVSDGHAGVGYVLAHDLFQVREGADAVTHDEGLSAAAHFELHGLGDDFCREGVHLGLYGVAVGWRRL